MGMLPRYCNTYLRTLCHLGILWANRGDHKQSLELLQRANDVYTAFTRVHVRQTKEDGNVVVGDTPTPAITSEGTAGEGTTDDQVRAQGANANMWAEVYRF